MTTPDRTIRNPPYIPYRYQDIRFSSMVRGIKISEPRRSVHREAADPSVVRYRNRYYMFVSMSAGFWHSAELVRWENLATSKLPALDYAPGVREIDGALHISASRKDFGTSPLMGIMSESEDRKDHLLKQSTIFIRLKDIQRGRVGADLHESPARPRVWPVPGRLTLSPSHFPHSHNRCPRKAPRGGA
ncbi:hypothetical protein [Streptomyces sp. NRRL F-525]|uniref:hypothetical protein n=1 Tax=Streptomyces sp. NRRL F-525 TaxID=1463861 RepID=UPI00131BDE4E|nr:hypothetical protein [Streptomyces sp. NRRL F-525]